MRFQELAESDRDLSFAVVGLRQGASHIRSIAKLPDCHVSAICDLEDEHLERGQNVLAECGRPEADEYHEYEQLLEAADVDVMSLALPIPMNAPASIQALEAGFHTFCEKPVANSMRDARRLKQVVEETGLVYQVGFELRHSPLIQSVMEHVESGRIGAVTSISGYHFWKPFEPHIEERQWGYDKWSGNVLFDCMSHTFDLINLLAGGRVQRVYADLGHVSESYADKEVPETGAVTIAYDNGVRSGVSFTETCDMPKVTILTVAGDDGKVEIDFSNAGSYKLWFGKGFYKEGDIDPTTTEPGHLGYDEQFLELRNAIVEDRQPYSDVDVGIESLLVSYGAVLSGDAGRPVTREELMQLED